MSRLRAALKACRERGEKAMGLFLTSGFPDPGSTLAILREMDAGGADFVELGMPFSDPLAEGRPIQRSSERALGAGIRIGDALSTAAAFRSESETPLLLMGYMNPIHRYGVASFCRDAREAGVDALILVDLPLEESAVVADEAAAQGLGLVHLIAPNTDEKRIRRIDEAASAFVYAVSVTGLTGSVLGGDERVEAYLHRASGLVRSNPLLVGFGIRTHEDAVRLSRSTDGFIVGSALIEEVERLWNDASLSDAHRLAGVRRFAEGLKHGERTAAE